MSLYSSIFNYHNFFRYNLDRMSDTNWLSQEEMTLWRTFIAVSSGVTAAIGAEMKKSANMNLDDYEVLVHLSEAEDNRLRMSELSSRILHSRSRLTQRVDRLVKMSFVERQKCDEDARGTWTVLTSAGKRALEEAAPAHVDDVREYFFDHIDRSDMEALTRALNAVAERLRQ